MTPEIILIGAFAFLVLHAVIRAIWSIDANTPDEIRDSPIKPSTSLMGATLIQRNEYGGLYATLENGDTLPVASQEDMIPGTASLIEGEPIYEMGRKEPVGHIPYRGIMEYIRFPQNTEPKKAPICRYCGQRTEESPCPYCGGPAL